MKAMKRVRTYKAIELKNDRDTGCLVSLVIAVLLITILTPANSAVADEPLNGAPPRPFYICAHNPNNLSDVESALQAGANALEPDITLAYPDTPSARCSDDPLYNLVNWDSSFPLRDGLCDDTKLVDWLDGAHDLAIRYPQLALVVFDIKSSAATAENGPLILNAIRTHLNGHGVGAHYTAQEVQLNVILSVATRDDGAVFDHLMGPQAQVQLSEREGVQIDAENDVADVLNFFFKGGYEGNIGYGDGTAGFGPNLFPAMDKAVFSRAATGYPKAVTYVYTIDLENSMRAFLDAGVDGIIPGDDADISELASIVSSRSDVVLATRDVNPFQPPPEAYGLVVRTADDEDDGLTGGGEGTDAFLTFTLEGELGTASVIVNTYHAGRMEAGDVNYVTIPCKDLGALRSITIHNDGSGNGPDWKLLDINVYSARWLQPGSCYHYMATFDDWIRAGSTKTLPFRLDEYAWSGFGSSSDGSQANPWKSFADAYCAVPPGGTVYIAGGTYGDKLSLTKPCTLRFWADHGPIPAIIGGP
jgi:hypothetical protein